MPGPGMNGRGKNFSVPCAVADFKDRVEVRIQMTDGCVHLFWLWHSFVLLCAMGPKRIERRAVLVEDVE